MTLLECMTLAEIFATTIFFRKTHAWLYLLLQILETLTEYCQGPCYENQVCIAMHESNGLGIITALILNDINPLGMTRMDLVLELKNNASKLLLAIMESRTSGRFKFIGSTTTDAKKWYTKTTVWFSRLRDECGRKDHLQLEP